MKILFSLLLAAFITFAACNTKDKTQIGGKGGNATLNVYPAHHLKTINLTNMVIYIKYNTSDAPTDSYDDSVHCIDNGGVPYGTFPGLKKGNYYLYGKGYDTSIHLPVRGGAAYPIADEVTQTVNLAVSEE